MCLSIQVEEASCNAWSDVKSSQATMVMVGNDGGMHREGNYSVCNPYIDTTEAHHVTTGSLSRFTFPTRISWSLGSTRVAGFAAA